jgi:hypothetical protein
VKEEHTSWLMHDIQRFATEARSTVQQADFRSTQFSIFILIVSGYFFFYKRRLR